MSMEQLPFDWIAMRDIRRRRYATAVWIPLRLCETIVLQGTEDHPDSQVEFICANSVAIPVANREQGNELGWSEIGLMHEGGPCSISADNYKHAEKFRRNDIDDVGVELVIVQHFNADTPSIWHPNQDMVVALGLLQDGDTWVRAEEGFVEVMRRRRAADDHTIALEIKSEYLRDYLAARGLALRLATYRQRCAITEEAEYPELDDNQFYSEEKNDDRLEVRQYSVDERGGDPDISMAVFHMWRTDVDPGEDVPVFERENDENTDGRSYSRTGRAAKTYEKIEGKRWREEWIEPSARSLRVRGETPVEEHTYIVAADGSRERSSVLDDEDIGKYLWFRPAVINELLSVKGGGLGWYTRETGSVWYSKTYPVHWGLNDQGLINVYACDVAGLPHWQQNIWAGFNTTPEGGVSRELLAAQMEANPAHTSAPEIDLLEAIDRLESAFAHRFGQPLMRAHDQADRLLKGVHRFRALEPDGTLRLAKEITRISIERLDKTALLNAAGDGVDKKLGTLKLLEKCIEPIAGTEAAHRILGPLVGIYDLRGADAHLPTQAIADAFLLAGVDQTAQPISQGMALIQNCATALNEVAELMEI